MLIYKIWEIHFLMTNFNQTDIKQIPHFNQRSSNNLCIFNLTTSIIWKTNYDSFKLLKWTYVFHNVISLAISSIHNRVLYLKMTLQELWQVWCTSEFGSGIVIWIGKLVFENILFLKKAKRLQKDCKIKSLETNS